MSGIKLIYEGDRMLDITEDTAQLITKHGSTINTQIF